MNHHQNNKELYKNTTIYFIRFDFVVELIKTILSYLVKLNFV